MTINLTLPTNDDLSWLDRLAEQQAEYWRKRGISAHVMREIAEAIEKYGDDFFDDATEQVSPVQPKVE